MFGNHDHFALTAFFRLPWAVKLVTHTRAHSLNQEAHWFAFNRCIAFDTQDVLIFGKTLNTFCKAHRIHLFRQVYHNAFKVVVVVIVVMMVVIMIMIVVVVMMMVTKAAT